MFYRNLEKVLTEYVYDKEQSCEKARLLYLQIKKKFKLNEITICKLTLTYEKYDYETVYECVSDAFMEMINLPKFMNELDRVNHDFYEYLLSISLIDKVYSAFLNDYKNRKAVPRLDLSNLQTSLPKIELEIKPEIKLEQPVLIPGITNLTDLQKLSLSQPQPLLPLLSEVMSTSSLSSTSTEDDQVNKQEPVPKDFFKDLYPTLMSSLRSI